MPTLRKLHACLCNNTFLLKIQQHRHWILCYFCSSGIYRFWVVWHTILSCINSMSLTSLWQTPLFISIYSLTYATADYAVCDSSVPLTDTTFHLHVWVVYHYCFSVMSNLRGTALWPVVWCWSKNEGWGCLSLYNNINFKNIIFI